MPIPRSLHAFYEPKEISARQHIKIEKKKGNIKECSDCGINIGKDFKYCGVCEEKRTTQIKLLKWEKIAPRKGYQKVIDKHR